MKKVMIVEDNALNMRLFNDLLEASGYATVCLSEGAAVMDTMRTQMPDLVLMDIQLPEMSGFDLIAQVKADAEIAPIPVIAITAFAMRGDEDKIKSAGFQDYIAKPISVLGFIDTVRSHLESKPEIGETAPLADSVEEAETAQQPTEQTQEQTQEAQETDGQ